MRRFTQKIAELYSPGVCLIVGSYTFVERGSGACSATKRRTV
jgi:hypothetical protein